MAYNLFASAGRSEKESVAAFERRLQDNRMLVVRRFARGNVAIQQGRVLTEAQLENERAALRASLNQVNG